MRGTPQGNIELMPKEEVLDLKPPPRLEQQVDDERADQVRNREHRSR
jgi:hypothetical protein